MDAVKEATKVGVAFRESYFDIFDRNRSVCSSQRHMPFAHTLFGDFVKLIDKFYLEDSALLWNGEKTVGRRDIYNYLRKLPPIAHKISVLDVQPYLGDYGKESLIVVVRGSANVDKDKTCTFNEDFVIKKVDESYYIQTQVFRSIMQE